MFRWNRHEEPENGLPPPEVRLVTLSSRHWEDDIQRARILVELTPFLQPPNLEFLITDANGEEVSSIYMVEVIDARMTFTMHLRDGGTRPPYMLRGRILYEEQGVVDDRQVPLASESDPPPEISTTNSND